MKLANAVPKIALELLPTEGGIPRSARNDGVGALFLKSQYENLVTL